MIQIIFLEDPMRFILPSLQKTGRASEDPNLPIDDRGKIILPYKNDETPINKRMIGFTLRVKPN